MKLLLDDGDQHVGGHGAPNLRLHRVGGADKNLDWLNRNPKASAVCCGAEAAERYLDARLIVPADIGVQGRDELVDGGG